MKLTNKKVLVYGLGKSGLGAIELLKKLNAKIFVYDDNEQNLNNFNDEKVTKIESITENFLKSVHLLVVNPCVSIYSENLKVKFNLKHISSNNKYFKQTFSVCFKEHNRLTNFNHFCNGFFDFFNFVCFDVSTC